MVSIINYPSSNVRLIPYSPQYRQTTLRRIREFWGFHSRLVGCQEEDSACQEDLSRWTSPGHWLYVIVQDQADVGFLHLQQLGPIVLQLEDLFVDQERRGQGVATAAIALAEQQARQIPGIQAVTLSVVSRNLSALRLYHRLGYDTISLVTLRKELGENPRTLQAQFQGLSFRV